MRIADALDLPPTLSTAEAAEVLGCSTDTLWTLARTGHAPVEPLNLGRRLRWPTAPLLAALGLSATGAPAATPTPRADQSPAPTMREDVPDGTTPHP